MIMEVGSRKIAHFNVTGHPTADWTLQQFREVITGDQPYRFILWRAGWNEKDPVLVICPNNPFWWPVNASVAKYLVRILTGAYKETQYRSVYFHMSGAKAEAGFERYITSIANAIKAYRSRHKVFPVFVGMERLDRRACQAASQGLGDGRTNLHLWGARHV